MKTDIKNATVYIIALLYILLFVYAAVSKLLDFQNFQIQVAQSPLLTAYADFISTWVIIVEITIAILLSFPLTRLIGLFSSFALMVLFTLYIYIILHYSPFVPCSCGGILEDMNWTQHLYFNIFFAGTAILAVYFAVVHKKVNKFYVPITLTTIVAASTILMTVLFLSSENIVAHRNNFIRRFPPFPAKRIIAVDLKFDSYYLAGHDNGEIYLGNNSAPALITVVDTTLKIKSKIHVNITDTVFKFHNVQLRVQPPYFFIFDGTVPCVFRGKIKEKKALLISRKIPGFTKAEIIDSTTMVLRTLSKREHLLTTVKLNNTANRNDNPSLLQKQTEGIFSTDGTLQFDPEQKKFVYLYYYRNQYIVADENLKLLYRGTTIDTTSKAKIKIKNIKSKKHRTFSAPPLMVNRVTAFHGNLLFVNSALQGKYDTDTMWENANFIDVYDVTTTTYVMSFYVYKLDGEKISDMMVTDTHLYALLGNNIVAYRLSDILKAKFHKSIPAGTRSKTENL